MNNYKIGILKEENIINGLRIFSQAMDIPAGSEREHTLITRALNMSSKNLSLYMGIEIDRELVGVGGLLFHKTSAWIINFGIIPPYQGKGLGSILLKKLLDYAYEQGFKTFELYATKKGEPLYTKFNFKGEYTACVYSIIGLNEYHHSYNLRVSNDFPLWALYLDELATGVDRSQYLKAHLGIHTQVITIPQKGYALMVNDSIGPVIATDINTAVVLVQKGYQLGAKHITIPLHPFLPNEFYEYIKLENKDRNCCLKMFLGEKIIQNIQMIYAHRGYGGG